MNLSLRGLSPRRWGSTATRQSR